MVEMPPTACYEVLIDWDDDGDTSDPIEDVSMRVLATPGIAIEYGRDTARSFGPPMIGIAEFVLDNRDRALSPENASGPAYQQIKPGRRVSIAAHHGTSDLYREHTLYREHDPYRSVAVYSLGEGQLETFEQHPEYGGRNVSVTALSTIKNLQRRVVSVEALGDTRPDTAIYWVLEAAGWPLDQAFLDVSDSVMDWFWVAERPAWDVLVEMVATEGPGSLLYQDAAGALHWRARNHRAIDPRSTTPQARLHDGSVETSGNDLVYTALTYAPQWSDVITRATIATNAREIAASPEVVWSLGRDIVPSPAGTVLIARPSDPFFSAIAPVATTDYTVTGGAATVALSWANGVVARLIVTATSGIPTVSGLQLRAYPLRVVGETQVESSVATPEPTLEKTLSVAAWPELDLTFAQAICDSYIARYSESRPIVTVTVPATSAAMLRQVLEIRLSDRLTLINAFLGIEADVFVERIRHEASAGGSHQVVLSCELSTAIGTFGAIWDHPSYHWDAVNTVWGL